MDHRLAAPAERRVGARPRGVDRRDPAVHDYEAEWLRHLESSHSDVVEQLAKHLPAELRDGRIRPLGLDRFGLRLRVELDTGDHDVRLAFSRSVNSPPQLAVELRRLVGCPFLRR